MEKFKPFKKSIILPEFNSVVIEGCSVVNQNFKK